MKKTFLAILSIIALNSFAQTDSTKNPLSISGYIETYYSYDFANPSDHNRPGFVYSHNRHNEVNLNLGFIKAAYATDKVRANLALMTGTYANANLAAEPGVLQNIFEANAGVKISKKKNLWVDAGIFASHIGFESAIGKDCWNLTRSILADNSPYYESGVKVSYTSDNEKWFLSGLILNGWQRIQRVNGNNTPAFGHQLTFKPNSKVTLNSSSFVGSDTPDSTRQMISIAARGEYYSDANGVIISTGTINGFQTYGYSLNLDYQIMNNVVWRIEGRGFTSKDKIFTLNDNPSSQNYFLTTALAISF